jgi:hypothetical protein
MSAHQLTSAAAFNYGHLSRIARGVFVQVRVAADATWSWSVDARIDSASTSCVFGRQWAELLGLDWESGDPLMISTAAGAFQAYLHEVALYLLGFEWTAWVAFAEWDTTPPSPARDVLGLNGSFDRFLVAIDDLSETLYLEPRF